MCSWAAWWPLPSAAGAAVVADRQLAADFLLLLPQELVQLLARREPVLVAAIEDVEHRQAARLQVHPLGVDLQADAAAFQRGESLFHGGQRVATTAACCRLRSAARRRVPGWHW